MPTCTRSGLLLGEAIGGPGAAQDAAAGRPWRRRNPGVTVGLADIVQKCLAPKPSDRYGNAALLADDLRRELNDLPLRGVPNRSLAERWRKWRRRRPVALLRGAALLIAATAFVAVFVLRGRFTGSRPSTSARSRRPWRTAHPCAPRAGLPTRRRRLRRGLERAITVPAAGPLTGALSEQLRLARRGQKADALHDLAELIRFRYGIDLPVADEARALLRNIRAVWDGRGLLLTPTAGTLNAKTEQAIRTDLLDLAILWAELRERLAGPGEAEQARSDALHVLDEANEACGPSRRLDRLRRSMTGTTGGPDWPRKAGPAPESALDHYDVGRSYLRARAFPEAALEFQRVLDLRPQDFWPNFYQGLCAYRLAQFHDALSAFRTCTALAPGSAECYYNRALAADALGRREPAVRDYSRALDLDPGLAPAALNRGIIAYENGRIDDAVTDLRRALRRFRLANDRPHSIQPGPCLLRSG